jgi:hypothetical protein
MIIINLKGGLGNQMFQYATGLAMSINNCVETKIDASGYKKEKVNVFDTPRIFDLKDFKISKELAKDFEINKIKYNLGLLSKLWRFFKQKIMRQKYADFHPFILKKKNYYLDGYWQSEKNFINIRKQILEEFTLKKITENFHICNGHITNNSLSIHIRHGDYLNDPKTLKYHGVLEIDYYRKSYELIKTKTKIKQVVLFSDDIKWVKENFDFIDKPIVYASDFNLTAPEELILMSKCSHNIVANSSFSWWGAWLNQNPDKIVIAPKIWFKKGEWRHKNIVPKTWIKI